MQSSRLALLCTALVIVGTKPAHADEVDFNTHALQDVIYNSGAIVDGNLSFTSSTYEGIWNYSGVGAYNGTQYLAYYTDNDADFLRIATVDASSFILDSIEIGGSYGFGSAAVGYTDQQSLLVTGYLSDGATVQTSIVVPPYSFGQFSFASLGNLQSLEFRLIGGTGYVAIDNLEYSQYASVASVPEPAEYALLLSGFGLLALLRRRKMA